MFFMRSMILRVPSAAISPTSPVWKKPSASAGTQGAQSTGGTKYRGHKVQGAGAGMGSENRC